MASRFSNDIEIKFWDMVIPFLSTSPWLRAVFKRIEVIKSSGILKYAMIALLLGCIGFAGGFLYFSLNAIF